MADRYDPVPDLAALLQASLNMDGIPAACRLASKLRVTPETGRKVIEARLGEALGPVLNRERLGTVLSALEDAADYRREYQDGDCSDCEKERLWTGKLCGDHEADEAVASMYDLLHGELQEHQRPGEAATAAGTEGIKADD